MSIVKDEKELEYWSDQKLLEEAQTPTGRMPLFLIHTQIEKRKNYRASANARKETPATSIYEEDVAEFGGGGLGSMQQQMPMSPPPNQQMPPPQQMPMSAGPPQAGMGVAPMARGGLIRAEEGVHLPKASLPDLMGDYRGTERGNLTRKQIEELEKKIRSYKSNLKLSPFENVRKARNMSGGGLIRAQGGAGLSSAYIDPSWALSDVERKRMEEYIKKETEKNKRGWRDAPWGGIATGAGLIGYELLKSRAKPLTLLGPAARKWMTSPGTSTIGTKAKRLFQRPLEKFGARGSKEGQKFKYGQPKTKKTAFGGTKKIPPRSISGSEAGLQYMAANKLKSGLTAAKYGLLYPSMAYGTGKGIYDVATNRGAKSPEDIMAGAEKLIGGQRAIDARKEGLAQIDTASTEPEYRKFYSEYMQPEEEFQAELTDVESYRTTPEQRKNEATAMAYSGLASALSNVGMENIIKGISEITPEIIGLRKMQTEEQRVVDKNEADLRKGRRSDRMMAINMQLEWEKMENLRSSYEAAGKLEIWKAAYAAFTEQMQTPSMGKDLHSVDDFLYFFEFGEFPEKSLSPSDAVAAAGQ